MSGVSWLSNDLRVLFFSSLDSLDEFIRPVVPFLHWERIVNDAGNPFGLPSWYSFQGLFVFFLRNAVVQGRGKGRENVLFWVAFVSSKCMAAQEGSQFPFWRKKKRKQKNRVISRPDIICLLKPKEPQDKEKLERILCAFLLKILHGTRSLAVRVCAWSFSGLGCERNPCFS